ncbi:MAG: 30S ribosomal protein S8 [Gammaproteobacteria bacterium]
MLTDPISDMLTRIRNAQSRSKAEVTMPSSRNKRDIAQVLLNEGFINNFIVEGQDTPKPTLRIALKYFQGKPVIKKVVRASKPGRRIYHSSAKLQKVLGGYGIAIVSTSEGVMTDHQARKKGIGGEVWCTVY